ncbi:MAG: MFS transporter [Candidatus Acidiferrales bacterium]
MAESGTSSLAGRVAFEYPGFGLFLAARWLIIAGVEMQSVAVGWRIYEISHRNMDLGFVGLAQFLPGVLLFLVSGHTADRFPRRSILFVCYFGYASCSALLLFFSLRGVHLVYWIYATMVLLGIVRSFNGPASRAIVPQLVPEEHLQNAFAWGGGSFQSATILGPSIGGIIYAITKGPIAVYTTALILSVAAILMMLGVHVIAKPRAREPVSMETILAGLRYVWRKKIILGSISLDLFAVLLGGAVALLPAYASDILHTGPWGLGLLRCSQGIGAGVMAIFLAYRPLRRRTGATLFWCVAGFGVFTILFGISRNLYLSMAALILAGASDMVSMIIRAVLVQVATPDEMRGRVNAVDMVFIGASNQLGEAESGFTGQWLGTVPAVVLGGIGTLVVTALWAWGFPELRKADRLTSEETRD